MQILSRFQLRSLKQGKLALEEFVTKARLLVEDSGYDATVKEETLRDALLVFGLKSDKVRQDAIALGNDLTFKKVYDLAKIEESTSAQRKIITQGENKSDLHAVRSRKKAPHFSREPQHKPDSMDDHSDSGQKQHGLSFMDETKTFQLQVQRLLSVWNHPRQVYDLSS